MAIWQFPIHFIPRAALLARYGHIPAQLEMNKAGWDDYVQQAGIDAGPDFEDALTISWWLDLDLHLGELLPLLESFGAVQEWTARTEGLRSFGDTEASDISVCFDPKTSKVETLNCRLDLREIDKEAINRMFSIATRFDCLLMDAQGRLFPPASEALADVIQQSDAQHFVTDPRRFLEEG